MNSSANIKIVPLGGLGRVGGNILVFETEEDLFVVDCGVVFPTQSEPGIDSIVPDVTYVEERAHKLRAFVITHGHEDHIGALPFVLRRVDAPIYTTRFTAALLRMRFREHPDLSPTLHEISDHECFRIGDVEIQFLPVTHSIPGAVSLVIRTSFAVILHTGDFRLDPSPLDGRVTDLEALRRLGDEGIDVLLSDSTNALREGCTWSEAEVQDTIASWIGEASGRVFVTTFASHVHRIQMVIDAAVAHGRSIVPLGRSVQQLISLGMEHGFLRVSPGTLIEPSQCDELPPARLCILAAGCQGEPRSAMARMGRGQAGMPRVERGDLVIVSSRRIPGNERAVSTMVNNFCRMGARVIDDRVARVHTSGHAFAGEQEQMLDLCRPRFFIPVHGETRHLMRHAELAVKMGVDPTAVVVVEDGTALDLHRVGDNLRVERGDTVHHGGICCEGSAARIVDDFVLRDRRIVSHSGIAICTVTMTPDGRIRSGPHVVTRGIAHASEGEGSLRSAAEEVRTALLHPQDPDSDDEQRAEKIRAALRRFFRRTLDRRPLVVSVVVRSSSDA